jgi:uncharacterized protein involved in exopolysaccharide biosynthesis
MEPIEETDVHLFDYVKVVYKRKWLILVTIIVAVGIGAFRVRRAVPLYRTAATIRIDDRTDTVIRSGEVIEFTDHYATEKNINTHIQIMLSEPVIKELHQALVPIAPSLTPSQPEALKGFFRIEPVKDTNLIRIDATHRNAKMAQDLANGMATAYQDFTLQKRLRSSRDNVLWLTEEIDKLRTKMGEADHKLYKYKQKSQILSIENETKMQSGELSQLRSTYNETQVGRLELEAQIKELNSISVSEDKYIPPFLQGDLLLMLNKRLVAAKLELAELLKKYGPKHPKIATVTANIASVETEIDQSILKGINSLKSQRAVLKAKERAMEASIGRYTQKAMEIEQKQAQYGLLAKETELNKELYDILVAKLKEINITEGLEKPEVTVAEVAWLPRAPMVANKNKVLTVAGVVGLLFGLGFTFFLEYLDVGLSTREETERFLELPVLGVIPETQTKN